MTTGPNVRPGEKPPRFPAQARQRTENGALQFAGYYFKAFDWGYATNDPYLVQQISDPRCYGCSIYIRALTDLRKNRQTLTGGRLGIRSASIADGRFRIRAEYAVDVSVDEEATVVRGTGVAPRTVAPKVRAEHSLVFVDWRSDGWKIVEVTAK